jgi:hypothetical protein
VQNTGSYRVLECMAIKGSGIMLGGRLLDSWRALPKNVRGPYGTGHDETPHEIQSIILF